MKDIEFKKLLEIVKEDNYKVESQELKFIRDWVGGVKVYEFSYWHVKIEDELYRVLRAPFRCIPAEGFGVKMYYIVSTKFGSSFVPKLFDSINKLD